MKVGRRIARFCESEIQYNTSEYIKNHPEEYPEIQDCGIDECIEVNSRYEVEETKDSMNEAMQTRINRNSHKFWFAVVHNQGWQKRSGYKGPFKAETPQDLLHQILPNTDLSINVHNFKRNGFAIQCFHHDSPIGDEWYYVVPRRSK